MFGGFFGQNFFYKHNNVDLKKKPLVTQCRTPSNTNDFKSNKKKDSTDSNITASSTPAKEIDENSIYEDDGANCFFESFEEIEKRLSEYVKLISANQWDFNKILSLRCALIFLYSQLIKSVYNYDENNLIIDQHIFDNKIIDTGNKLEKAQKELSLINESCKQLSEQHNNKNEKRLFFVLFQYFGKLWIIIE